MQEMNEFQGEVREICKQYVTLVCNNTLFTQGHIQKVQEGVKESVLPLLQAQKAKVMVYGIYNSGKSTLVNAICRREVAEVADRPMTDRITEYDEGKYILIDSPGVNAPIHHEEIADSHLKGCHIILFVISSKGIFEDKVNYQKMCNLIKKGLPFYIILNERSEALPPKENKAAREQAIRAHQNELNDIKRKIIKNLMTISGMSDIGEKYDVIVLNAKRAWMGIVKGNEKLYQSSKISTLVDRIDAVLEGRGALKQLLAPLSVLEELIIESESFLQSQSGGQDFALKREILGKKINLFRDSFLADVQMTVEKQFDFLYNGYLGRSEIDMDIIWEEIIKDIDAAYMNLLYPLNQYMRESFSELDLVIDDRCNVSSAGVEIEKIGQESQRRSHADSSNIGYGKKFGEGNLSNLESIGRRQNSGLLDAILNLFKSKRKKEQEEHERLLREVDAYNADVSQRIEEEIRRCQDARTDANAAIDKMARQLRLVLSDEIKEKFDRVQMAIDIAIQEQVQWGEEIDSALHACRDLKDKIYELRREIG